MIKVFSAEQIRAADQFTIEKEPISSLDLMERAASKAAEWLIQHFPNREQPFAFFCGTGNNGGDGLVMARHLKQAGYPVQLWILELSENYAPDFQSNLDRLAQEPKFLNQKQTDFEFQSQTVVVDAIFGTGLNRVVEGFASEVIQAINRLKKTVVSVDLPSGLFADDNWSNDLKKVIQATYTLTFQFPKMALLWPESGALAGEWHCIDIGLHPDYIRDTACSNFLFTDADARQLLAKRKRFAHKGSYGKALILSGSKGKMGASILAARACLRSGVGLLNMQIPQIGYSAMQTAVPEAMVISDTEENFLSEWKRDLNPTALGIGPGIGQAAETAALLKHLIQEVACPILLDADALNLLADNPTWFSFLPAQSILTPHPGEFERLVGKWDSDYERHQMLKDFAHKYGLYIVLKGAHTAVACPNGKVFFNSTGNPGMASGGSGDALTGIITALLAQGHEAEQAALLGVYVHGLAGDLAAEKLGEISLLPSDLIENLPAAFQLLSQAKVKNQ